VGGCAVPFSSSSEVAPRSKWTALDRYVWTYDSTAGYEVYPKTYQGNGWTGYVLDFNSGLWKPEVSSRPLWQHWLTVCIPDQIRHTVATMYLDGPGNSEVREKKMRSPQRTTHGFAIRRLMRT
jgi:PhoPQ-activated pathogenicity-related protein